MTESERSDAERAADYERVMIDACNEVGCEFDNETLLAAIASLKAETASQAAEIARLTERAEFAENQMGERIAAVERAGASRMRERAAAEAIGNKCGHSAWDAACDDIATAIAALPLGEK